MFYEVNIILFLLARNFYLLWSTKNSEVNDTVKTGIGLFRSNHRFYFLSAVAMLKPSPTRRKI